MRLNFLQAFTAAFFCVVPLVISAQTPLPPNIVLIVADDLGIEIGVYGDKQARTPHMDRLASEGVRFLTVWVTAASCSPSRGSIHTGLYPHQNGLIGLGHHGFSLNERYPTIASHLKDAGYRTGVIGKFHLHPQDISPWDYMLTQEVNRDLLAHNRDVRGMSTLAEGFVAGNTGPFFLMMSYIDPHVPLYPQRGGLPERVRTADETEPLPFLGFDSPGLRQRTADYYNCIDRLDSGIGLFLEMLERNGALENTLIVLVGDHGAPFARAKMSTYDRGMRIPFLVRGPGVSPGMVSNHPVSTVDILPTLLDAMGLQVPDGLPGETLWPILKGDVDDNSDRPLFGSYHAHQADAVFPSRSVRHRDWLLIHNLHAGKPRPRPETDGCELWPSPGAVPLPGVDVEAVYEIYLNPPQWELYDLARDPYCFRNLSDSPDHQDTLNKLKTLLKQWRRDTHDPELETQDDLTFP